MEIRWKAYNHIYHPKGDLLWHLWWGFVVGVTWLWSIFSNNFWLLIISIIALIFFFHPKFYTPKLMEIKLNEEGIFIDKKFYPWDKFYGFEIFNNSLRKFVYLLPKNLSLGLHFPIEEIFVSENEVRGFLNKYLKEYKNKVSIYDRLYRFFYP